MKLRDLIKSKIGDFFESFIKISFERIEDKNICRVDINKPKKWAFLNENNKINFYLREGNRTKLLEGKALLEYQNVHPERSV